jgi:hypothetical protein
MKPHFICNLYVYIQQIGVRIGLGYINELIN